MLKNITSPLANNQQKEEILEECKNILDGISARKIKLLANILADEIDKVTKKINDLYDKKGINLSNTNEYNKLHNNLSNYQLLQNKISEINEMQEKISKIIKKKTSTIHDLGLVKEYSSKIKTNFEEVKKGVGKDLGSLRVKLVLRTENEEQVRRK